MKATAVILVFMCSACFFKGNPLGFVPDDSNLYPFSARVVEVELELNKIVVETLDSNLIIVARFENGIQFPALNDDSLVSIGFYCAKNEIGECNFESPYELRVAGQRATALWWSLCKYTNVPENQWVAHSPFDDEPYAYGFMVHSVCGDKHLFLQLRFSFIDDVLRAPELIRGDSIHIVFNENLPYYAAVVRDDGVYLGMRIVAIIFSDAPQPN